MFNENSVGQRVISKKFGIGTITEYWKYKEHTLEVSFDNDKDNYEFYTSEGKFFTYKRDSDKNIIPYWEKQGSPDARRIVAMLAAEYRRLSYRLDNYRGHDSTSLHTMEIQSAKLYLKAKQLLIRENNNERI